MWLRFNAAVPKLEGTDAMGLQDSSGKLFMAKLMKTAQKGWGWVDCMWPAPLGRANRRRNGAS